MVLVARDRLYPVHGGGRVRMPRAPPCLIHHPCVQSNVICPMIAHQAMSIHQFIVTYACECGARTRRQPLKRAAWCGAGGVVEGGSAWPSGPTRPHASRALVDLVIRLCARQWCAVASAAVWSLYPVHVMPCARQWCAAASVAVLRACGMVARVHQALGPLGQKLRQMSVGGSVPDEDVCSRGVGAHTH
jgi:hypothetical protein